MSTQLSCFKYLDLSNIRGLSIQALCMFFTNCEFLQSVSFINISNTNANETVILSIASSQQMTSLSFISFDQC